MGSEGPVLEATASASFQGGVCRAGPGESMWLNVPPCEPTSSPRGAHGRPQGSFTLNFRSREGAKASGQYRAAPRSPRRGRLREPGHDGRRYQSRSRGQRLAARWLPTAPADAMAVTAGPSPNRNATRRRRLPTRGPRGAESRAAFSPLGPRLCVTAGPRPARRLQGHEPHQRKRVDSETSAWLPPRTPGLSPGPTELTLAEPETARAPGVATRHYSKRFRVTGGFRGRKGTQPHGYLS